MKGQTIGLWSMILITAFTVICYWGLCPKFRHATVKHNGPAKAMSMTPNRLVGHKVDQRSETEIALNRLGLTTKNSVGVSVVSTETK